MIKYKKRKKYNENIKSYPYTTLPAYKKLIEQPSLNYNSNDDFEDLLSDLQANIIRHHRKKYAKYLFITFKPGQQVQVLNWIAKSISKGIKNGLDRLKDYRSMPRGKQITGFYLSFEGYKYLDLVKYAPSPNRHQAFGENRRFENHKRGNGDLLWETGTSVHAVILITNNKFDQLEKTTSSVIKKAEKFTSRIEIQDSMLKIREVLGKEKAVEWFGFVDGISRPSFFPDANKSSMKYSDQRKADPLSTVLVKDKGGKKWYSSGSFVSILKIEQNVERFNQMVDSIANKVTKGDKELAAAYLIGRFKDGTPLTLYNKEGHNKPSDNLNDFDYDNFFVKNRGKILDDRKGIRCPFHSHIRKANPRIIYEKQNKLVHEGIKIARHGMLYDDRDDKEENERKKNIKWVENEKPNKGVGMLFTSYQSSLEYQFKQILFDWLSDDYPHGADTIISANDKEIGKRWFPKDWNVNPNTTSPGGPMIPVELGKSCTQIIDGGYFFAPSISFLENVLLYDNKYTSKTGNPKRISKNTTRKGQDADFIYEINKQLKIH